MKVKFNLLQENSSFTSEKDLGVYLPLGDVYLSLSNYSSKYFGLNWKEYKILDLNNLFPLNEVEIKENSVNIDGYNLSFSDNKMEIDDFIPIFLDIRHLYDYNPFNRKIEVKKINNKIEIISNTPIKMTLDGELREIKEEELKELKKSNVILNYSFDGKNFWIKRIYELDKRRGEKKEHYEWYVLFLGYFKGNIFFNFKFKDKKKEYYSLNPEVIEDIESIKNENIRLAVKLLIRNIMDKVTGRPWFFQEWKRDFLISLRAFEIIKDLSFIKKLLLKYFNEAYEAEKRGKLYEKFKTDEFGLLLNKIVEFWHLFNEEEKNYIKEKLNTFHFYAPIYNHKYDTWMDTLEREGFSIEIQFLFSKFFRFFKEDYKEFSYFYNAIKKTVKEMIINDLIIDGKDRYEIRPNFLLAWYFDEELAKELSFNKYLNNMLEQLLTDWGGISSISKCHPLHYKRHTGIDSRSYHNGDSWFFINNITALILLKEEKVDLAYKIIDASLNDFFLDYFTGAHSEISSSSVQEGFGCFDQLWSNATLLEVLAYLFLNKENSN